MKSNFDMTSTTKNYCIQKELDKLMNTPSPQLKPGSRILQWFVKRDPSILERMTFHEKGNYWWVELHSSSFGEILLCFWNPNAWSERHDHYYSFNLTMVLLGQIIARLYHLSGSKFFTYKKSVVNEMEVTTTPPFQVHSIANLSDELAVSLHFYTVRRPSLVLEIEE